MTDSELLRFVFTFYVVDQIVQADGRLEDAEVDWVLERFPHDTLVEHGLVDDDNVLTDRYRHLLADALMKLPQTLSRAEKLELIETFFDSAESDGEFAQEEGQMIMAAAQLLALPLDEVTSRLPELGELDLDA